MGYERKSIQILGGGFSCLPPGDKVPITDYLLAQNWRADSLGRLVTRAGYPLDFSITGAGIAHSAANTGGAMDPYYVGANNGIASPVGSLYYNGNPAAIATGFDGNRIGFATQNGYMWVMNRGNKGRHSVGAGWETWNLTPPPASATVAAGSSPSPTSSATYAYNFQGESVAADIAVGLQTVTPGSMGTIAVGTRLGFGINAGDYEIVTVLSVTATTFTAVFVYAHPGASVGAYYDYVHSLTIAGVVYSFVQNGYSQSQIPSVMAGLAGVDPNCSVTYVGTGQDVVITPIIPNTLIPISGSDGNSPENLAAGSITSLPNGTYQFYLTFQSADLSLESNPGPASLPVTVASQAIVVILLAADNPVDVRVGFVNIYATGGTLGAPYRVGQVVSTALSPAPSATAGAGTAGATNASTAVVGVGTAWTSALVGGWIVLAGVPCAIAAVPSTTSITLTSPYAGVTASGLVYATATVPTFTDTIPDLQATANGIAMPTTNDPPPAAAGVIGPWFSRLLAWSSAAHKNRLWYTDADLPQYWPGSADNQIGNWVDVGLEGEAIVWLTIHTNLIVIYKERSIWMLILDTTGLTIGSLQQVHDGIGLMGQFALAPAGLIDYFVGPNNLYIFDMNEVHELGGAVLPIFNQSIVNAGHLTPPGSILPGTAFNSRSVSNYAVALGHALGKLYVAYAEQGSSSWNMLVYAEGSHPELAIYTAQVPGRWFYHRNAIAGTLGFFGFFFDGTNMLGLTGSVGGPAQGLNVDDFRGFLTTDSGDMPIKCVYQAHYEDCGLPDDEKEWLEAGIDYEGGETASVYAGYNAGVLAVVGGLSASARTTVNIPLRDAGGDGTPAKNLSIAVVFPNGNATLHNVYLFYVVPLASGKQAATGGFVADSVQMPLGGGEVSTLDQLRFEMSASAACSVQLFTDLPGGTLASVGLFPLTLQAAYRGWVTVPLPDGIEARSIRVRVTSPAGFRIYAAQARHNRIGRFLSGTAPDAAPDAFNTLEFDFNTERRMMFKRLELDLRADAVVNLSVITDQDGDKIATIYAPAVSTPNGRTAVLVPMVPGVRGRLMRLKLSGPSHARIHGIRVWAREMAEPKAAWAWVPFPLEASEIVPTWVDLPFTVSG